MNLKQKSLERRLGRGWRFAPLYAAMLAVPALAQQAGSVVLPDVTVSASGDADYGFGARKANSSTTKSDTPLFETSQSVSVLTRELLDSRQVTTLNEALQTVAGVSAGSLGRRGWDDFTIRGQTANDSIYIDGLRLGQANWFAQETYGVERIDVLKGPASINFGQVQPGGVVNMVSKRPRAENFNEIGFTAGSYNYLQGTFDMGRVLSKSGKSAFRLNGMMSDQDDPTDFVYSKTRYLAPSLSLDLGPDTEFTILTAYTEREYMRQQGVPLRGSLLPNINGTLPRSFFVGEPSFGPYDAHQGSIGYALTHQFASGWKLRQNFRAQDMHMTGRAVFHLATGTSLLANQRDQRRDPRLQDVQENTLALDTNIERVFKAGSVEHTVMVGLDLNHDKLRNAGTTCTIGNLNIFNPVYGVPVTCPAARTSDSTTTLSYAALYLRDQIKFDERWRLNLAMRYDDVRNEAVNNLTKVSTTTSSSATTGNAALMYVLNKNLAPYVSYATSFTPLSGVDFSGAQFTPEEGRQGELGVKLQSSDGRISGTLARYELARRNVLVADPDHTGFNVQTGEQRTKGFEAEMAADLKNGWSVVAAYAYTDAFLASDTTASRVGRPLQNVPRHAYSVWSNYNFSGGLLNGLGFGLGVRHEGEKTSPTVSYSVPAYTVADASISYAGNGYRVSLIVKNLFDKDYYAGVLNNNVVPLGTPRMAMLKTTFNF